MQDIHLSGYEYVVKGRKIRVWLSELSLSSSKSNLAMFRATQLIQYKNLNGIVKILCRIKCT